MTSSSLIKSVVVVAAVMVLASCARPVTVLQEVPIEQRQTIAFTQVDIAYDETLEKNKYFEPDKLIEGLNESFEEASAQRGDIDNAVPTAVSIEVLAYREANAAMSLLLGDTAEISGYVRLRDLNTDTQIGEYYVTVVEGEADMIGLATALANEKQLSSQFVKKFFRYFYEVEKAE